MVFNYGEDSYDNLMEMDSNCFDQQSPFIMIMERVW